MFDFLLISFVVATLAAFVLGLTALLRGQEKYAWWALWSCAVAFLALAGLVIVTACTTPVNVLL